MQAPKEFLTNITPSNSRFVKNFTSEKTKESIFGFPTENSKFDISKNPPKDFQHEKTLSNQFVQLKKPPMFYVGSTPPGLTPKKSPQKEDDSQNYQNKQFQFSEQVF